MYIIKNTKPQPKIKLFRGVFSAFVWPVPSPPSLLDASGARREVGVKWSKKRTVGEAGEGVAGKE